MYILDALRRMVEGSGMQTKQNQHTHLARLDKCGSNDFACTLFFSLPFSLVSLLLLSALLFLGTVA